MKDSRTFKNSSIEIPVERVGRTIDEKISRSLMEQT